MFGKNVHNGSHGACPVVNVDREIINAGNGAVCITHSRERAEGAVRLEFYDKTSLARAREVLSEKRYTII